MWFFHKISKQWINLRLPLSLVILHCEQNLVSQAEECLPRLKGIQLKFTVYHNYAVNFFNF